MLKLRLAEVSDAEAISEICSRAWRVTYKDLYSPSHIEKVIKDFYDIERVRSECRSSSADWHGYMIAEREGQIVGCIGGASEEKTAYVYVLYIEPSVKGQGIGKALLDFLTTYQINHYGISEQEVFVTKGNQMGIPFYESKGFKSVEEVVDWIDARQVAQIRYRRQLPLNHLGLKNNRLGNA